MNDTEVLVIEDSVGDVLLIKQILNEMPIRLRIARDGLQALLILADPAFKPSLVILDLNIPDISGREVLARYHPKAPPVVVFSSSWNEGEKTRALAMGARDYVTKPMDLDAYVGALRGMVQKWVPLADKSAAASTRKAGKTASIQ